MILGDPGGTWGGGGLGYNGHIPIPLHTTQTKKTKTIYIFLKSFYLSGTCTKIIEFQMNEICIPERIHN